MKRALAALAALVLLFALAPAAMADVDLSALTFDELVALKDQINLAIWNSAEWQEVEVPQGVWEVGEDIPAGKWTLRSLPKSWTDVTVGHSLDETGSKLNRPYKADKTIFGPEGNYYSEGNVTEWTFELAAGDLVQIDYGPAVFTPYAGKPSLGFK